MKIKCINGLKGICCVLVSIGHMSAILLPSLYFGETYKSHTVIEKYIYETPLNICFNSSSALMCFLVLSGFLIPLNYFFTNQSFSVLEKWGLGKYSRLMPMALIGVLFAWGIQKFDLVWSYRITDLSYSYGYASNWNNFTPGSLLAKDGPVYEGLIRVFLINSRYNNPLGSLKYIWLYSLILYIYTKWISPLRFRDFIYTISCIIGYITGKYLMYEYYYFGIMVFGMWICDFLYNEKRTIRLNHIPRLITWIIFAVGIILLSIPVGSPITGVYSWVRKLHISHCIYWAAGWGLLIIAITNLEGLIHLLEYPILQKLGDISFAYFAVHWPIIISFTCWLTWIFFNYFHCHYVLSAVVSMVLSIPIILLIAVFVQKVLYKYLYQAENFVIRKLTEK